MKSRIIGLTGGVATGKSVASRLLQEMGATILDADEVSKQISQIPEVQSQMKQRWPQAFPQGNLDRKELRRIIFSSKEEREKLNQLLHPLIIKALFDEVRASSVDVCVLVAPLLFETGLQDMMDEVWVVHAPRKMQIARLMQRDTMTEEAAIQMIDSQLPIDEKMTRADVLIDNGGSIEETKEQLRRALVGERKRYGKEFFD